MYKQGSVKSYLTKIADQYRQAIICKNEILRYLDYPK